MDPRTFQAFLTELAEIKLAAYRPVGDLVHGYLARKGVAGIVPAAEQAKNIAGLGGKDNRDAAARIIRRIRQSVPNMTKTVQQAAA